jgi:hypothetical protein
MKPSQVYEFMKQFYGGAENIPFSRTDYNNEIGRERKKYLESNDAQTLLEIIEYLKNQQIEDPAFFYAIQIDKPTGRITNFFWADGRLSWITNILVMLSRLTSYFRQISLKCLLLHSLEPTITSRQ